MSKKIFSFISLIPLLFILLTHQVYAVCPVCTVAVVAGLGLSRWLGIDDTVSGIWLGGLILSLSFWTSSWLTMKLTLKPKVRPYLTWFTLVGYALIIFLPLSFTHIIGHPLNMLWGIDKLLLGSLIGIITFTIGVFLDKFERKLHDHQLFQFQKVISPVVCLIIMSIIFLIITKK